MRILHITATHLRKTGGIPVVLDKLTMYQNQIKNVESRVLSVSSNMGEIDSQYFYYINSIYKIEEFIDRYNPDVTIIHSLYYKEYVAVSKLLRNKKMRYFIQPHSSFGEAAQKKSKFKKTIVNYVFLRSFIKGAYGYIFLNETEKNDSQYKTANDIIIPNGIESDDIPQFKNNKRIRLYFIGRLDISHKGLDYLIEALEKLDKKKLSFEIDFYGLGTEKEIKFIKNHISKLKNIKSEYKGPIYDKEKVKILSQYDIMILTSRYEGFPITILEALSYGCPCIVTDGTNVRSIIEENNLGWGCGLNQIPETIEKAIYEYSMNKEMYRKQTRDFVINNYSWAKIARESVNELIYSIRVK